MSNIRLIKRRIRVAKNISQVTKAMQMVAASKMKKAQERAVSGKPYAQKILELVGELTKDKEIDPVAYPLLKKNLAKKNLAVLISTNKGLCGGLNSNLFRSLNNFLSEKQETDFITFGEKGRSLITRLGRNLIADFSSSLFLNNVGALLNLIVDGYVRGDYAEVYLVYNNFMSILNHEPVKKLILPIGMIVSEEPKPKDFLIEPDVKSLLNQLLPHYLEVQIRKAILEAEASEHSARMMAMKSATDNAVSLMGDLTLEYNKARQQIITYELADITTAREAITNEK